MNAFELSAVLSLNADKFTKGIKSAESGFQSFGKRLTGFAGKITAIYGAVSSAAIVSLGKASISAYAETEQLIGGVKTLYKDSWVTIQKYATNAYKEAGVSANKYMEISTSFAASLVSSLGGDTDRAAELANTAIVDMSDNANKMGTDITSIQNAYNGFAKQNFTMLDNLKLGYGGTKKEMERLLKTAGDITGKKFDISNFADIVEAIHTIQDRMGISGTTKDEAGSTIQGSINMMKNAWQDLVSSMANPEASPELAVRRFVGATKTMLHNVLPEIKTFTKNIGFAFSEIAPIIGEELPQIIADFVPGMIDAGGKLLSGLGKGIVRAAQRIKWPSWDDVKSAAEEAWNTIVAGATTLAKVVFGTNVDGTIKWPTWDDVGKAVETGWNTIVSGVEGLAKVVFGTNVDGTIKWPTWDEIGGAIETAWSTIKEKVSSLAAIVFGTNVDGTIKWPTWDDIGKSITDAWETIKTKVSALGKIVFGENVDGSVKWPTWGEIGASITEAWNYIIQQVGGLAKLVFGTNVDGTIKWPKWSDISTAVTTAWDEIVKEAKALKTIVFGDTATAASVFDGIRSSWTTLKETIEQGAINIANYFFDTADPNTVASAIRTISDVLTGLAAGVITYTFVNNIQRVFNGIKSLFTLDLTGNKIGIILAAVATAFTLIYENWGEIQPVLASIGEWVNTNIISPFTDAINTITDFINKIKELPIFKGLFENDPQGAAPVIGEGKLGGVAANNLIAMYQNIKEGGGDTGAFSEKFKQDLEAAGYSAEEIDQALTAINEHGDPAWVSTFIANLVKTNSVAEALKQTVDSVAGDRNIDYYVTVHGPTSLGEYGGVKPRGKPKAIGDWNVPYDNFPALLHRNEMVLTASQARRYRNGEVGGASAQDIASAVRSAVMDLAFVSNGETIGRVIGDQTTNRVNRNIGQMSRRHRYGYGG